MDPGDASCGPADPGDASARPCATFPEHAQRGWPASGSSTDSRVPPPERALEPRASRRAPRRDRRARAVRCRPPSRAPPTPSSATSTSTPSARRARPRSRRARRGVLARRSRAPLSRRSRSRSRAPRAAARSDTLRSTGTGLRATSDASASASPPSSRPPGADRRRDRAARRARERAAPRRLESARPAASALRSLERVCERRQAPFDRLAQPPLEPASLLVAGVDQAPARFAQLVELRPHLGLQACVRGREPRCRGESVRQTGIVEHGRVVHQHRDRLAVSLHGRDLTVRPLRRQRERPSLRVDVALAEPVADLERRIAERPGERVAQRSGARLAQVDDEVGDPARAHGSTTSPARSTTASAHSAAS